MAAFGVRQWRFAPRPPSSAPDQPPPRGWCVHRRGARPRDRCVVGGGPGRCPRRRDGRRARRPARPAAAARAVTATAGSGTGARHREPDRAAPRSAERRAGSVVSRPRVPVAAHVYSYALPRSRSARWSGSPVTGSSLPVAGTAAPVGAPAHALHEPLPLLRQRDRRDGRRRGDLRRHGRVPRRRGLARAAPARAARRPARRQALG